MSELVTGEAYVAALAAESSDRITRAAFVDLARRLAPPRGRIFDFGCGPGVDARAYAELGFQVTAHDVDADMRASFRSTCAAGLARGDIGLLETVDGAPPVDLIAANFAPLNLVPAPAPLFAAFHAILRPGGRLLASVLNPLYLGDLRYAWWWRGLAALVVNGHYQVPGAQAPVTRWRPSRLMLEAWPWFVLEAVSVPLSPCHDEHSARALRLRSTRSWPLAWSSRFLFLQMRKLPERA